VVVRCGLADWDFFAVLKMLQSRRSRRRGAFAEDHAAIGAQGSPLLKRDEIGMNRHRALGCCLSMIFSESRFTLFRIML
jgi:hypothetical protein